MSIENLSRQFSETAEHVLNVAGDVAGLKDEIDAIHAKLAAALVGGAGGGIGKSDGATRAKAMAAFSAFARRGDTAAMAALTATAAMHSESDPDGGYLIPNEIAKSISEKLRDVSPMRRLASVVSTSSSTFSIPFSLGGTQSGWVGERESRPETDPSRIAMVSLPAHEIYAMPGASQKLIDDNGFDLGNFIVGEIAREFEAQEGAAFVSGDGVNKPRGFLTYPTATDADATRAFGTLQYVAPGAAADFASTNPADCLADLVFSLRGPYRAAGAAWVMNSLTLAKISKFKDG